jgi:hypothetical protein
LEGEEPQEGGDDDDVDEQAEGSSIYIHFIHTHSWMVVYLAWLGLEAIQKKKKKS